MKKLVSVIRIELTNEQTQQLLDTADIVTYLSGLGALTPPIPAAVLAVVGAYVGVNRVRIARANKGNGVIISIPYIHPLLRGLLGPGASVLAMLPSGIELLSFSVRSR